MRCFMIKKINISDNEIQHHGQLIRYIYGS